MDFVYGMANPHYFLTAHAEIVISVQKGSAPIFPCLDFFFLIVKTFVIKNV